MLRLCDESLLATPSVPLLFQVTQVKLSQCRHQSSLKGGHPSNRAAWALGRHLILVNNAERLEGGLYMSRRSFQDRRSKAPSSPLSDTARHLIDKVLKPRDKVQGVTKLYS